MRLVQDFRIAASAARYLGLRYEDPICRWRFRALAPSGTGSPNAICPWCWSAERTRLLWLFLQRELDVTDGQPRRILHAAPERGLSRRLRRLPRAHYVSTDITDRGMVRADLQALPFRDGTFDLVLCSHVLEHVPDDRQAMREIRRVLDRAGVAVMQHPVDAARAHTHEDPDVSTPEDRERMYFQHDHLRLYGADFADRLADAGLDVQVIDYRARLTPLERARYALDPAPSAHPERDIEADIIYVCRPA
jgi:SAM-dependent methyltransferase